MLLRRVSDLRVYSQGLRECLSYALLAVTLGRQKDEVSDELWSMARVGGHWLIVILVEPMVG